jgi:hypothetical protein
MHLNSKRDWLDMNQSLIPGNESFYRKFNPRLHKTAMVILNIPEYPEEDMAKLME